MSKIYAKVGDSQQIVIADGVVYSPQEGEILMQSERPTDGEYVAKKDGTWGTPTLTKEEKLAALDSEYETDKAEIMKYYVDSVIHMDVDLTNELADEMILLDRQYKKDREEIEKE